MEFEDEEIPKKDDLKFILIQGLGILVKNVKFHGYSTNTPPVMCPHQNKALGFNHCPFFFGGGKNHSFMRRPDHKAGRPFLG